MPTLTPKHVSSSDLLLDPNNLRFQDSSGFLLAAENRFHESGVQDQAYKRLRTNENLADLKRSIMRNGYIPVEQIVARPYAHLDGKYVIVEGNRRTGPFAGFSTITPLVSMSHPTYWPALPRYRRLLPKRQEQTRRFALA